MTALQFIPLTCRSFRHSISRGTARAIVLVCERTQRQAIETCEAFEYEPGTDEKEGK